MIELIRYQLADGREPFSEWLSALRDNVTKARIRERLRQVEAGNLGDIVPVGNGVFELRVHFGAGYRVYIGRHQRKIVILLLGGDKSQQAKDIRTAKVYWADWKLRQV